MAKEKGKSRAVSKAEKQRRLEASSKGGRNNKTHGLEAASKEGIAETNAKFGARMDEVDLLTQTEEGRVELARQGLLRANLLVEMGTSYLLEAQKEKGVKVYDEALLKRFGTYMEIARRHLADYHRMAPPDVEGAPNAEILRMDALLEKEQD